MVSTILCTGIFFITGYLKHDLAQEGVFYKAHNIKSIVFRSFLLLIEGTLMNQLQILLPWSIDIAITGTITMVA